MIYKKGDDLRQDQFILQVRVRLCDCVHLLQHVCNLSWYICAPQFALHIRNTSLHAHSQSKMSVVFVNLLAEASLLNVSLTHYHSSCHGCNPQNASCPSRAACLLLIFTHHPGHCTHPGHPGHSPSRALHTPRLLLFFTHHPGHCTHTHSHSCRCFP